MELTISLLAYGEAENLDRILPSILCTAKEVTDDFEVRIVDGKPSRDNTEEICRKYQIEYVNQEEPYYGGAYRTAIRYARGKYFVILDADGSHDPSLISQLYRKEQEGYDVVIASRYVKGGGTHDQLTSILMSRCLNFAYRLCLGLEPKDVSTSYRIFRTEQLKKLSLECSHYDTAEEILFKLKLGNPEIKMGEIPMVMYKRMEGESKRQLGKFIVSLIKSLVKFTGMRMRAVVAHKTIV